MLCSRRQKTSDGGGRCPRTRPQATAPAACGANAFHNLARAVTFPRTPVFSLLGGGAEAIPATLLKHLVALPKTDGTVNHDSWLQCVDAMGVKQVHWKGQRSGTQSLARL